MGVGETRQLPATLCIIMLLLFALAVYSIPMKGHFLHNVVTPPILFTTSSFSTLYLARGVICYIRYSEEFYPFYQHQEFLGKLCYHRDSMRIFVEILQLGEMLGEDTYFWWPKGFVSFLLALLASMGFWLRLVDDSGKTESYFWLL